MEFNLKCIFPVYQYVAKSKKQNKQHNNNNKTTV